MRPLGAGTEDGHHRGGAHRSALRDGHQQVVSTGPQQARFATRDLVHEGRELVRIVRMLHLKERVSLEDILVVCRVRPYRWAEVLTRAGFKRRIQRRGLTSLSTTAAILRSSSSTGPCIDYCTGAPRLACGEACRHFAPNQDQKHRPPFEPALLSECS
ncbi:MAG: hypothetical protein Q8S42_32485 [Archangium sp.]|nr:hypothetical protein [Archangium sp.]